MTPEFQSALIRMTGAVVQVVAAMACIKFFPNNPELLATVMGILGTAYGMASYSSPISAVRRADGLVSVRAPHANDAEQLRAAIRKVESITPPPPEQVP